MNDENDHRTKAELFVVAFKDFVNEHDILDHFNKKFNRMERSPGMERLIKQAQEVFPRVEDGKAETDIIPEEALEQAIQESPNVIDTREIFSARIQRNGGLRRILADVADGKPGALEEAQDFMAAERGEREFYVPPKK